MYRHFAENLPVSRLYRGSIVSLEGALVSVMDCYGIEQSTYLSCTDTTKPQLQQELGKCYLRK